MSSFNSWELIDSVCDAFESEWSEGKRPRIEDFLQRVPEQFRQELAVELLLLELELRARNGQRGKPEEYLERLGEEPVRQAFQRATADMGDAEPWIHDILSSCATLHGLRGDILAHIANRLTIRNYAVGDYLMREGQPSFGLHILLQGVVEIRSKTHLIDRSGPSAIVGEISLLTDAHCTADVIAVEPVRTLVLSEEDYRQLREDHAELEVVLGELVADRLGSRDWDALCGKTLHGYDVLGCLRRGGMGVVYEASTPIHESSVALKMLRHSLIHDSAAVTRFQREGEFLKSLQHDNIVAVHDVFVEYRTLFLAMDLCDGEDLGTLLHELRGPLEEGLVRRVLGQIAAGLRHAQARRIVHLDVKPSNVLIFRDGTAKLCDFGLSRMLDAEVSESLSLAGTPRYMAPEQLSALGVGPESDWYAFGCVACEMLTGKPLFHQEMDLLALSSAKAAWRPPKNWNLPASDELKAVLRGALQPLPEHRELDLGFISEWSGKVPELLKDS